MPARLSEQSKHRAAQGKIMRRKKITEIIVETDELLIVRMPTSPIQCWCNWCETEVAMTSVDNAALLSGTSSRSVYRQVESGEVHFTEMTGGLLLICLNSLLLSAPERRIEKKVNPP
ncbi:MAG: hypothetical protein WBP93_03275 [Pyrinomonadaceae bacterium]